MFRPFVSAILITGLMVSAPAAKAAFVVTFNQVGSDVVATGSGTLDTSDLRSFKVSNPPPFTIGTTAGILNLGPATAPFQTYLTSFTPSTRFGTSGVTDNESSGTGDKVTLLLGFGELMVPSGYVSGSSLSDTSTFAAQTFDSLGITPGTYVYQFGQGVDVDTFTVQIEASQAVPEPSSSFVLLGAAGLLAVARGRWRDRWTAVC